MQSQVPGVEPPAERLSSIGGAVETLRFGGSAQRRQAANYLASLGAEAIPFLTKPLQSGEVNLREGAFAALKGIASDVPDAVLPLLKHKKRMVREAAAGALATAPIEEARTAVIEFVREETARRNRMLVIRGYVAVSACALTALALLLRFLFTGSAWRSSVPYELYVFYFFSGLSTLWQLSLLVVDRHGMISALGAAGDARYIKILAQCLWDENPNVCKEAERALVQVLPLATEADGAQLSVKEKRLLVSGLLNRTEEYQLALLNALEKVGDAAALPAVEQLLKKTKSDRVRAAAENCLPYLREWATEKEMSQHLLRASSLTEVAPETLLRPTTHSPDAEADRQTLLRGTKLAD